MMTYYRCRSTGKNVLNISKPSQNLYLVSDIGTGRLGNILFNFASSTGIAHHTNRHLVISPSILKRLKKLLPSLKGNTKHPSPVRNWTHFKEYAMQKFEKKFYNLPEKNITLWGYLQSFKYFENISNDILTEFSKINPIFLQKVDEYKNSVFHKMKQMHVSKPQTVCVHVRRGDLLEAWVAKNFNMAPAEDILFAMDYIEQKYKSVIFFIASDGKEWCNRYLKKNRENVFISNLTTTEEDFALLQSCDHMIMTVGTFGWWAGWMTSQRGGDVLYYRYHFKCHDACDRFERADHFPSNWLSYYNKTII